LDIERLLKTQFHIEKEKYGIEEIN
jgi:hypothetical protein